MPDCDKLSSNYKFTLCYGSLFCLEVMLSFKMTRQGTEALEILRKTHTWTHLVHHIYLVKYTTWIKLRCLKLLILLLVFQHLGKVRDEDFQPRLEIKEYWMSCFSSLSYHSIWFPWLPVAKEGTPGKLRLGDTSSLKRRHITHNTYTGSRKGGWELEKNLGFGDFFCLCVCDLKMWE